MVRPWLLPALSVGWLIGVLIGSTVSVPREFLLPSLAGPVAVYAVMWNTWKVRLASLAALAALFGIWRANGALHLDRGERAAWESLYGEPQVLHGVVAEAQARGPFTRLTIGSLQSDGKTPHQSELGAGQALPGFVRATAPGSPGLTERARVTVRGKILKPEELRPPGVPPRGDLERVFARAQVFAAMRFPVVSVEEAGRPSALTRTRHRLRGVFLRMLPEPAAGLYSAFLLSFDYDLPRSLREQAAATGLLHLVAISGSHIVAIAAFVFAVATLLGLTRRTATVLTLGLTVVFLALVGFPESGVRSGIMAGFVGSAYLLGRQAAGLRALVFAAAAMTAVNPRILLGDVGFQLSALAVWGLLVLFPLLKFFAHRVPDPFHLTSLFLLTVAAEVATLPVQAYAFGRVPLVGPLTNLFAGALFPAILASGALLLALGLAAPALAALLAPLAALLGNAFLGIAEVGSRFPFHALSFPSFPLATFLGGVASLLLAAELARVLVLASRSRLPVL